MPTVDLTIPACVKTCNVRHSIARDKGKGGLCGRRLHFVVAMTLYGLFMYIYQLFLLAFSEEHYARDACHVSQQRAAFKHVAIWTRDLRNKVRILATVEKASSSVNVTGDEELTALARAFSSKCRLNPLDALHVSAACLGNADSFLTCDDLVLRKRIQIANLAVEKGYRLKVRNPVSFIEERQR
jgi:predicted nucleic acid-binding protein